jgi:RNA polymerase sigma factor (sigma-70 family)
MKAATPIPHFTRDQTAQRADALKLWKRYARSGPGSKTEDELVNQYLPLVRTVVGRLAMTLPAHAATEDLYSAGLVGLLNAVRRYNHKTGVLFETYARVRIRGAVFDELRRLDWVPRSVHDKARKVEEVMRQLEQKRGQIPTHLEMASALEITEEEYEDLLTEIRPATFVCLDSVRRKARPPSTKRWPMQPSPTPAAPPNAANSPASSPSACAPSPKCSARCSPSIILKTSGCARLPKSSE